MQNRRMRLINITDIATYALCPVKIYYKLVLGRRERFNAFLVFGRIKHKFLEEISRKEPSIFSSIEKYESIKKIETRFRVEFNKIYENVIKRYYKIINRFNLLERIMEEIGQLKEKEIKIRTRLARKFVKLGYSKEKLWQAITPKFLSEVEIKSFVLGIKGRVDKIMVDKEKFIPYEIKSRKYGNKIWLSEKLQLTGYAMLIEQKFKTNVDYGFLKFRDKIIKLDIERALKEKLLQFKEEIIDMVEKRKMPDIKKLKICKFCSFNNLCFD